jgi:hypothetical protein
MDAQEYFESLTAQNYPAEEAEKYTQEHYPDFSLAPTTQAPATMPASVEIAAPGVTMQDSVIAGDVVHYNTINTNHFATSIPSEIVVPGMPGMPGLTGMPGMPGGQMPLQVVPVKKPSAAWRIINGLSGIILSLPIVWLAFILKGDYDRAASYIDSFGISLTDDIESAISTISLMWTLVIIVSFGLFVVSLIQFANLPWGPKALLGTNGLLILLLVLTGYFETDLMAEIGENTSIFETNGGLLSLCSGACLLTFGLFAFLGRQKGPSVELQQM